MFVPDRGRPVNAAVRVAGRAGQLVVRWTVTVAVAGVVMALLTALLVGQARNFFTAGKTGSDMAKIDLAPLATRSILYAADGTILQYLKEEDRLPVSIDKVPPHVVKAVLDAEDDRFFQHGPIDLRAMTRAMISNLEAGQIAEGGSTITQQLVKTALLTPKKDVSRKLQEASLAIRLEKQMTKTQILERYLNTVYFGNGAYGLQAAAETYYQVNVDQLSLGQGVLLAGLIRNPVGADPFNNPDAARDRRDAIIDRMVALGDVTADEAVGLKAEPLPTPQPAAAEVDGSNYFTRHVVQQLLDDPKYLGGTETDRHSLVFKSGLSIHTTLLPSAQAQAEQSIAETLPADRGQLDSALVSVDPATGAVRAAVSGLDFAKSTTDLVTGEGRQVGSAFKTFTLMAAMEAGDIPADTILGTSPCSIPNPGGEDDPWKTQNNEGESAGLLNLTDATAESVNCAYARLIKLIGPDKVVDVAKRMGVGFSSPTPLTPNLSLTLGTSDVTPLDMASAYATLATDGEHHDPYFIDRIEDHNGNVIYKSSGKADRAVSVQNARTVVSVLQQVVQRGTGTAAAVPKWTVAGKTGSTDNNTDAWFVGFTPKLATAVWMGAPTGKVPMYNVGIFPKVFGGTYPAMIFSDYMTKVLAGQPPVDFTAPDRVPNQRAPKTLVLPNEPTPSFTDRGSPKAVQSNDTPSTPSSPSSPTPTTPSTSRPTATTPPATLPDTPVITRPTIPDITIPNITVPPDVPQGTTPTTRRPRGVT